MTCLERIINIFRLLFPLESTILWVWSKKWEAIFQKWKCWTCLVWLGKNKDSSIVDDNKGKNYYSVESGLFFHNNWTVRYNHVTKGPWTGVHVLLLNMRIKMRGVFPQLLFTFFYPVWQGTSFDLASESDRLSSPPCGVIVEIVSLLFKGFSLAL